MFNGGNEPSPVVHTSVEFLTQTQPPKWLDARAFAALIASLEGVGEPTKQPYISSSKASVESEVSGTVPASGHGPTSKTRGSTPTASSNNNIAGASEPLEGDSNRTGRASQTGNTNNAEGTGSPSPAGNGGSISDIVSNLNSSIKTSDITSASTTNAPVYVAGSQSLTISPTEVAVTVPATEGDYLLGIM